MKQLLKSIIGTLGYEVKRRKQNIEGYDSSLNPFYFQRELLGKLDRNPMILDVGAFHGQTVRLYKEQFPSATIHAFEPFSESMEIAKQATSDLNDIHFHGFALGKNSGRSTFHLLTHSPASSLLELDEKAGHTWGSGLLENTTSIEVEIVTLADFVRSQNLKHIDILKLDTQGLEYEILNATSVLLADRKVSMVYTEIITMPTYKGQKGLEEYLKLLNDCGFELFNFFNLSTINGQLRQVDALFFHPQLIKK